MGIVSTVIDLGSATQNDLDIDVTDCHELRIFFYDSTLDINGGQITGRAFTSGTTAPSSPIFKKSSWDVNSDNHVADSDDARITGVVLNGEPVHVTWGGFASGSRTYCKINGADGQSGVMCITQGTDEIQVIRLGDVSNFIAGKAQVQKISWKTRNVIPAQDYSVTNSPTYTDLLGGHIGVFTPYDVDDGATSRWQARFSADGSTLLQTTSDGGPGYIDYQTDSHFNDYTNTVALQTEGFNLSLEAAEHWGITKFSNLNKADAVVSVKGIGDDTSQVREHLGSVKFPSAVTHLQFAHGADAAGSVYNSGTLHGETFEAESMTHTEYSDSAVSVSNVQIPVSADADSMIVAFGGITYSAADEGVFEVSYDNGSTWTVAADLEIIELTKAVQSGGTASFPFEVDDHGTIEFMGLGDGTHLATQGETDDDSVNPVIRCYIDTSSTARVTDIRFAAKSGANITAYTIDVHEYVHTTAGGGGGGSGQGGVQLDWRVRAPNADELRIYRDTATFDEMSLPAVLATLTPANTITYTDATVEGGTTYYYGVASVFGGTVALSNILSITPENDGIA